MSFKVGDLVVLSKSGINYAAARDWPMKKCSCTCMIIAIDSTQVYFGAIKPKYSVLMISDLIRLIIVESKDIIHFQFKL